MHYGQVYTQLFTTVLMNYLASLIGSTTIGLIKMTLSSAISLMICIAWHHVWLSDKRNQSTADAHHHARKAARARLSLMKNNWWLQKAEQLQLASDQHNCSGFYQSLKEVFGPSVKTIAPLQSVDNSSLLYGRRQILTRLAQHFESILNHPTFISQEAIDSIDEQPDLVVACEPPSNNEINKAI